ncbi:MAG: dihydrofolate reductase family protein [Formivibrio sp.]|nr:dihydrofolate reductase family protein [Formivibrio sp.]
MESTRKVSLFISTSLDGYIAREDGSIDWLFDDQDYGYEAFYDDVDTVIMGRHTWEQLQKLGDFYPYQGKEGVVFSRGHSGKPNSNVTFATEPIETWLARAKQEDKGTIWLMGGAKLVDECLQANLVDEIILSVHPILLGQGIPLFRGRHPEMTLELVSHRAYHTGLVQLVYRRPVKA